MSYEPTTWETGDVITAQKFNSVSPYISEIDIVSAGIGEENLTTHATAGEIFEAVESGRPCIFINAFTEDGYADYRYFILMSMSFNGDSYTADLARVTLVQSGMDIVVVSLTATSADDPLMYDTGGK